MRAKRSFVCRHVEFDQVVDLSKALWPSTGDVVLAAVNELGHHVRLESPEGRRVQLYVGDEVLVAYGARYAPDQFESVVPSDMGACDLVAAGGIASRVIARHANVKRPTVITPLGILTDAAGCAINLRRFVDMPLRKPAVAHQVVAVVGTSMNAGKTTAAANLIRGLSQGGLRVGACKLTGTGSGGDLWAMRDAGAVLALDFTDEGFATTAGADLAELEQAARRLLDRVESADLDVVVVEIADGLLQRETAALLNTASFVDRLDAVLLAAADSLGALMGAAWLRERHLPLRAVTGLLTSSPLAAREAQQHLDVDVVHTAMLLDSTYVTRLCFQGARRSLSAVR
ncbi:MAG: molybdopterin-guanine dinucleotide biosynthesis protein MobB [Immundisolibacter sp.]|uniref:molybdopterin-guanine dinucleotide biosynthesis protein MobB n=1 Tax=Immundisolibacter sp. TaxID=1934948 RepID=UPI003D12D6C1